MKKFFKKVLEIIFNVLNSYLLFFVIIFLVMLRTSGFKNIVQSIIISAIGGLLCFFVCIFCLHSHAREDENKLKQLNSNIETCKNILKKKEETKKEKKKKKQRSKTRKRNKKQNKKIRYTI